MRKKDFDTQLSELEAELAAFKTKYFEIEKQLLDYKRREASISGALTMASEAKEQSLIQVNKLLIEAKEKAESAINSANRQADGIIASARIEADSIVKDANKKRLQILSAASDETDKTRKYYVRMGKDLTDMAQNLLEFIKMINPSFTEKGLNKRLASYSAGNTSSVPGEYKTPAELYHSIMKLRGDDVFMPEDAIETPEFVTLDKPLLNEETIDNLIKPALALENVDLKNATQSQQRNNSDDDIMELINAVSQAEKALSDIQRSETKDTAVVSPEITYPVTNASGIDNERYGSISVKSFECFDDEDD